uniref:Uncharacterized protein n=1 Tax=Parascaris univalens TaxID=6257 RepID=A0A915BC55_PARUN
AVCSSKNSIFQRVDFLLQPPGISFDTSRIAIKIFWKNFINYLGRANMDISLHPFHHFSLLVKLVGRTSGSAEVHIPPTPFTCCSILIFYLSVLRTIFLACKSPFNFQS